ncbi:MAG: hypothetical protein AAFR31_02210 [Cyanobacteria bacterium J06627_8]
MKTFQKAIAAFLLCIGFASIGLSVLDLINSERTGRNQQRAIATLLVLGCVPVGVGGYMIWARFDQIHRQEQQRLRAAFFRLVRAGQGRISASDFSVETNLSIDEARLYLDERAEHFGAACQVEEDGKALYGFQLGYADPKRLLEAANETMPTFSILLKTIPSEHEDEVLIVLQDLMKAEPESIKEVWNEPLLPIQIGITRAIAQDYRKRLEEAGATVLVVLD